MDWWTFITKIEWTRESTYAIFVVIGVAYLVLKDHYRNRSIHSRRKEQRENEMEQPTDETPRIPLCKIGIMRLLGMRYPTYGDGEIFKRAATHIDAMLEAMEAPPELTEPVASTGETDGA